MKAILPDVSQGRCVPGNNLMLVYLKRIAHAIGMLPLSSECLIPYIHFKILNN
jgi:hypothetical protein